MKTINQYTEKINSYSPYRYIIELSFLSIIGKAIIAFIILSIILISDINLDIKHLPEPDIYNKSKSFFIFFKICIFAPLIETIIAQWLPITILNKMTSNVYIIVWFDALLFTMAHWPDYGFIRMLTVLPVALILAWSFFSNRESFFRAFYLTASIHSLCNIFLYLLN